MHGGENISKFVRQKNNVNGSFLSKYISNCGLTFILRSLDSRTRKKCISGTHEILHSFKVYIIKIQIILYFCFCRADWAVMAVLNISAKVSYC